MGATGCNPIEGSDKPGRSVGPTDPGAGQVFEVFRITVFRITVFRVTVSFRIAEVVGFDPVNRMLQFVNLPRIKTVSPFNVFQQRQYGEWVDLFRNLESLLLTGFTLTHEPHRGHRGHQQEDDQRNQPVEEAPTEGSVLFFQRNGPFHLDQIGVFVALKTHVG